MIGLGSSMYLLEHLVDNFLVAVGLLWSSRVFVLLSSLKKFCPIASRLFHFPFRCSRYAARFIPCFYESLPSHYNPFHLHHVLLVFDSIIQPVLIVDFLSHRMSGGTRSAVHRNRDRVRNRNDDEPPPPPSSAEIMMEAERNRRDQTRLLELIEQNTAHNRNVVVSIQDFILLKPPVFRCSSEPLEADDWLRSIERKLDTTHVAPDDWVIFAVYFLEGAALQWWENYVAMQPNGHVVTWQEFCVAFRGYLILDELMERKKEEFCNLTQGEMTIHEYVREFNRLARYAQDEITTDARKQARFRKGLSPILRHDLNPIEFATFEDLVNRSFRAEHGNEVFEESRKHALEHVPSSSSASQKRRIWIPTSAIPQNLLQRPPSKICHPPQHIVPPRNDGVQSSNSTPSNSGRVCFNYGLPGHYFRQCPQVLMTPRHSRPKT